MEFFTMELVIFLWALVYLFESCLDLLQLEALEFSEIPPEMEDSVPPQIFNFYKENRYNKRFMKLHHKFANFVFDFILVFFKLVPWVWKVSGLFLGCLGLNMGNEFLQSILFIGALQISYLAFYTCTIFAIDPGHDQQRVDSVRAHAKDGFDHWLTAAFVIELFEFLKWVGIPYSAIFIWGNLLVLSILKIVTVTLFEKFTFETLTPLQDGELKKKIVSIASSNRFPLDNILVGSGVAFKHSHTYVFDCGILKKSIILYEGLINEFPSKNEAAAMVAHQIGHWKFNHLLYKVAFKLVQILLYYGIFEFIEHSSVLYMSFGFNERSTAITFLLFTYVMIPVNFFIRVAKKAIFRSGEFKVDAFTRQQGYGAALRACLLRFRLESFRFKEIAYDPWFSAYRFSRPSFTERLAALHELEMKNN